MRCSLRRRRMATTLLVQTTLEVLNEVTTTTTTTTVEETTTPPPGLGIDFAEAEQEFRIPRGIWVWLLLIVPCCIGICILFVWFRLRNEPVEILEPAQKVEKTNDNFGMYGIVKPIPAWEKKGNKKPVVFIDVGELPAQRPLGIELRELKVTRVHAGGKRWGWEVGDNIVEIAGQAVFTFEELWDRIQAERDRCPVRFIVERDGAPDLDLEDPFEPLTGPPGAEATMLPGSVPPAAGSGGQLPAEVAALRGAGGSSLWVPGEQRDPPRGDPGLPSAVVGWEAWVAHMPEPPEEDDVLALEQKPKRSPRKPKSTTTAFMRAFPETAESQVKKMRQKPTDVGTRDVRYKIDAWGRQVIQVGG